MRVLLDVISERNEKRSYRRGASRIPNGPREQRPESRTVSRSKTGCGSWISLSEALRALVFIMRSLQFHKKEERMRTGGRNLSAPYIEDEIQQAIVALRSYTAMRGGLPGGNQV